MTNKFEQRYVIDLAGRLVSKSRPHKEVARALSKCIELQEPGFCWDVESNSMVDEYLRNADDVPQAAWKALGTQIASYTSNAGEGFAGDTGLAAPDRIAQNIAALAAHVSLDADEEKIFHLAIRAAISPEVENLCSSLTHYAGLPSEETLVHLTGIPINRVRKAIAPTAKLMIHGLLQYEEPPTYRLGIEPPARLLKALEPPAHGLTDIMDGLFAAVEPATVSWDDFGHIGPGRELTLRILQGALKGREKGINILLHGVPGTGKTEFCKVLGRQLGASLLAVGEADDDGEEPNRRERLQQLRLAQRMFSGQGNTVILFDEMEDVLKDGFAGSPGGAGGGDRRAIGSKVHMNRLFETNAVPTLWTTNDIESCDPALMRRITLTLELRTPPVNVRARIWRRLAKQHDVPLSQEQCREFAKSMRDAPALASSALRTARIARGGVDDVRRAASALARAVRGGRLPPPATGGHERFDPQLANADHDLDMVTSRIVASWAKAGNGAVGNNAKRDDIEANTGNPTDGINDPAPNERVVDSDVAKGANGAGRANGTDSINVAADDDGSNRDNNRGSSVGGGGISVAGEGGNCGGGVGGVGINARGTGVNASSVNDANGMGGLCLSGAPGTGKSAFARYLADRLDMQVLERRASDILSCFVGGTEHMIAEAFAEARETGAFLIFDEVDSLLGSREHATQSWELSQVNEMLTWMESHPLPFACTTNLRGRLDAATVRRFALHIDFRPLSLAQRRACFERFFSCAPAECAESLAAFDKLTPGDFAVVAKRVNLLGLTDSRDIVAELRRVQETKPGGGVAMGFSAAA